MDLDKHQKRNGKGYGFRQSSRFHFRNSSFLVHCVCPIWFMELNIYLESLSHSELLSFFIIGGGGGIQCTAGFEHIPIMQSKEGNNTSQPHHYHRIIITASQRRKTILFSPPLNNPVTKTK
ncbi:unnamed protein product [Orchesella dallaii]|uniref:Uncharacterized protein n=1 Tax=Orchesella dallaii TaxID=48710 RepID=A0ABP1QKR4_9HEXA